MLKAQKNLAFLRLNNIDFEEKLHEMMLKIPFQRE